MMSRKAIIILIIVLLIITACGKNTVLNTPDIDPSSINFGTPQTLDVITWNLRTFPQGTDLEALKQIILALNVDVIAFQEIMDYTTFIDMASDIPNYNACIYSATDTYRLAYLYDTRTVTVNNQYTIYENDSNPFPRPPYILDITWENDNYLIINNHLKAFGDNYIDENNNWDEEVRRRLACMKLDSYISTNLPNSKVIVLGDMNDQIAEPPEYNVFLNFINKSDEYYFVDMPIAVSPNYNNVSYPNSFSHIDHILITNELFADFEQGGSYCKTILAENWMLNWNTYSSTISDHRPVGIRLGKPH
ncbi:MAG TPA: endonuclease/exonuclease/phosphatase family protein [Candidatus Cloacimonas sp.]|jgi:endonuclease/exonuclease/phosphatase family metal-dependent hydrolase|nr:endonuclease/exonuclease/phosphatase family protein [Candidatus Cloacimonas sp.]MDD2249509.1 endonuclease/exonuclease/phosphatase family protein [Candidatus Cloacimonadota bacterium]MCK9164367.1 endonuclease/exonuclease/phosphatase family protein [Candidatus Cloacimonas sp.]MDD3733393.1 endonuclease/exonuclease/phosphatase family protein [Candidatus Cloacimonadota bacterium]MDD3869116.1 endonuclease/exonuclease/phosphatase family protein [Candidatus Cloacimonadota bacterium]